MRRAIRIHRVCTVVALLALFVAPLQAADAPDGNEADVAGNEDDVAHPVPEPGGDLCGILPPKPVPAVTPGCERDKTRCLTGTIVEMGNKGTEKSTYTLEGMLELAGITIQKFREYNDLTGPAGWRICPNSPYPPVGTEIHWRLAAPP